MSSLVCNDSLLYLQKLEDYPDDGEKKGLAVISANFQRVRSLYTVTVALLITGLSKIFFQSLKHYSSKLPESCTMIFLGLIIGGISQGLGFKVDAVLDQDLFFFFILPPIVMEAGYFMPREPFFTNLGTILVYSIFGTLFNTFAFGFSMYAIYKVGFIPGIDELGGLTLLHCLLFGSVVSAVDPVAVISAFEEIHVNITLYILVFGESLLNDGVAVVLYNIFKNFIKADLKSIKSFDISICFLMFFLVSCGGLVIGIFFGYVGAFTTKYTEKLFIIEPTLVVIYCFLAYLTAEIFHFSGIIAIVFASFTLSGYARHNMSNDAQIAIKFGLKMLANINETLIFILLGVAAAGDFWKFWNTPLVVWTILFISVYRVISVFFLSWMINKFRINKVCLVDQFVMAYGGLRGAISFSLMTVTDSDTVPAVKSMVCATIVVVYFTCFIQGATIRSIVNLLKVSTEETHERTMFEEINYRLIEHVMAGIEDIFGHSAHGWLASKLITFHDRHVAHHFIRQPTLASTAQDQDVIEKFQELTVFEANHLIEDLENDSVQNALYSSSLTSFFSHSLQPVEISVDEREQINLIFKNHMYHRRKSFVQKHLDPIGENKQEEKEILLLRTLKSLQAEVPPPSTVDEDGQEEERSGR